MENLNNNNLNEGMIMRTMNFLYDKAVDGYGIFNGANEFANSYLEKENYNKYDAANSLIGWQTVKGFNIGFWSNLGGLLTLPISLPASFTGITMMQIRMVAAIAIMGGHDIKSNEVRTFVYMCLLGKAMNDIAKNFTIKIGAEVISREAKQAAIATLHQINRAVGFRLFTVAGNRTLSKTLPLIGGMISGYCDATQVFLAGQNAKRVFLSEQV